MECVTQSMEHVNAFVGASAPLVARPAMDATLFSGVFAAIYDARVMNTGAVNETQEPAAASMTLCAAIGQEVTVASVQQGSSVSTVVPKTLSSAPTHSFQPLTGLRRMSPSIRRTFPPRFEQFSSAMIVTTFFTPTKTHYSSCALTNHGASSAPSSYPVPPFPYLSTTTPPSACWCACQTTAWSSAMYPAETSLVSMPRSSSPAQLQQPQLSLPRGGASQFKLPQLPPRWLRRSPLPRTLLQTSTVTARSTCKAFRLTPRQWHQQRL